MSKIYLKQIVQQIKKEAQEAGGPPPGSYTGPDAPPAASQAPAGYVQPQQPRNQTIMNMQLAIQDLAQLITRDASSQTMFRQQQDARPDQGSAAQVSGKKAFSDFIAEQYMGTLDPEHKGVEWSDNPDVQSESQKRESQTDIYEMNVVMDTLRRIGHPGNRPGDEFKADGRWQFRTDNALKNIYGLAHALLAFKADFPGLQSSYTESNLREFYELTHGYSVTGERVDLSDQDKTARASKIIGHLRGIARMYLDFRRQFLSQASIRALIEGQRPLDRYDSQGTGISAEEKRIAEDPSATIWSNITGYKDNRPYRITQIPISALKDMKSFEDFLKGIGYTDELGPRNLRSQAPSILASIINTLKQEATLPTSRT